MSKKTIFIAEYAGYAPSDGGKPFCKFTPFFVLDEVRMQRVQKGYLILDDAIEKDKIVIEKLKAFPRFNKDYKVVEKLPSTANEGNVISGVVTEAAREVTPAITEDYKEKIKRLYELQFTIVKKDGSYRSDATEELIAEYEQLKEEVE